MYNNRPKFNIRIKLATYPTLKRKPTSFLLMKGIIKYKNYILYVIVINVICCSVIRLCLVTSFSEKQSNTIFTEVSSDRHSQYDYSPPQQNQSMKKNIFFLKTHKTASSTVQNILMRFGYRKSLNFLLPKKANYLGYTNPIATSDLDENSIPPDKKFNIFTHHTRYRPTTSQFLYPDAVKVTILRHPPELFESLFHFYNLQKKFNMSFEELIISFPKLDTTQPIKKEGKFGFNQMCHDLGLEREFYDDELAIQKFIDLIDKEFDFVMIKEYMEASLVLLANLMGWPLDYVSFIPLNSRTNTMKHELSEMKRFQLSRLNFADTQLYDHFLNKFRKCVLEYGVNRLLDDVQKLYSINGNLRNRCILKENFGGYANTVGYELKNNSDWECVYSTKVELKFTRELRTSQINRLKIVRDLQKLMTNVQYS